MLIGLDVLDEILTLLHYCQLDYYQLHKILIEMIILLVRAAPRRLLNGNIALTGRAVVANRVAVANRAAVVAGVEEKIGFWFFLVCYERSLGGI